MFNNALTSGDGFPQDGLPLLTGSTLGQVVYLWRNRWVECPCVWSHCFLSPDWTMKCDTRWENRHPMPLCFWRFKITFAFWFTLIYRLRMRQLKFWGYSWKRAWRIWHFHDSMKAFLLKEKMESGVIVIELINSDWEISIKRRIFCMILKHFSTISIVLNLLSCLRLYHVEMLVLIRAQTLINCVPGQYRDG